MIWIALGDRSADRPDLSGQRPDGPETLELMTRGAIVVDFDFSVRQKAPCRLVTFASDQGWKRRFTIFLNADYSLSLEVQQGPGHCYARLSDIDLREAGAVRLIYTWDAPGKYGLLSLEVAEDGAIHQAPIKTPIPMPLEDAVAIVCGAQTVTCDGRTCGLALADTVVAVGPAASIARGAMVATPDGTCAIERLRLGDLVLTKSGGAQPVRWIVKQQLPAMGPSAPIRMRAPFFGLSKDLVVAGDQRVLIAGSETEYNFGQEAVLIEAKNLVGHPAAGQLQGPTTMTYYQVLLDSHDCICVSGAWADSLYIGRLANSPGIVATTPLADVPPSILPVHRAQARRVLRSYERQALLEALTA